MFHNNYKKKVLLSDKFSTILIFLYTHNIMQIYKKSSINSVNTSGNFNLVHVDKSNAIVSTYNFGLLYSEDLGKTWIESNITSDSFGPVFISGPNAIAGSINNSGLFYSNDFGHTWTQSKTTSKTSITGSFNSIYMVGSKAIAGGNSIGLFYSKDYGHTWTQVIPTGTFNSVYMDELSTNAIAGGDLNTGLFYSDNSGNTWTRAKITNTDDYVQGIFTSVNINMGKALAVGNLYGMTDNIYTGILYSDDNGHTWTKSTSTNDLINFNINFNCSYLLVVNSKPYYIVGSESGLYYSSNGGINWNVIMDGIYFKSVYLSSSDTNIYLLAGSTTGIYYSTNGFENLTKSTNITSGSINSVYLANSGHSIANTNESLFYSENYGELWNFSTTQNVGFKSISIWESNVIAGSGFNQGLFYSGDYGKTFTQSNITSGTFNSVYLYGSNGIAGSNDSNLGLLYSNDYGKNWTRSINITNLASIGNIRGVFNSVYMCEISGIKYCLAGSNSGIFYSTDTGISWIKSKDITDPDTIDYINLPFKSVHMDLTGRAIGGTTNDSGIYYSENFGIDWKRCVNITNLNNPILMTGSFNSVFIVQINKIKYAIAGSSSNTGLWVSNDGGNKWFQSVSSGNFKSVWLNSINDMVYGVAGSDSNTGLYYSTNGGIGWTQSNIKIGSFVIAMGQNDYKLNCIAGSDLGIVNSLDGGMSWNLTNLTKPINVIGIYSKYVIVGGNNYMGRTKLKCDKNQENINLIKHEEIEELEEIENKHKYKYKKNKHKHKHKHNNQDDDFGIFNLFNMIKEFIFN